MTGDELLSKVRAERGYTLSYHEIFARTEPVFLERYADLYRAFTLDARYLSARERELVWAGILVVGAERVGTLHIERAFEAGLTAEEIGDAIAVAGAANSWPSFAFVDEGWKQTLDFDMWERYDGLLTAAAPRLSEREIQLVAAAAQAALQNAAALLHHLDRLYGLAVPETEIAEAISYLMLPMGVNAMLWATDEWLDAIESGRITAGELLDGVNTRTRRS